MAINYRKQIMELLQLVYPNGMPQDAASDITINMHCPDDVIRPYTLRFDPQEYELHRTGQLEDSYTHALFSGRDISYLKEMNITLNKQE